MNRKVVGYYNYTVILTYVGMLSALCGIWRALEQSYWSSILFLMLAGLCDMFDGAIAATKKDRSIPEKRFGIQIDSLSDLISFGACPAIFVYMISDKDTFTGIVCALFILCGLIRLAYYNTLEEERLMGKAASDPCFLGVPITTVAMLLPVLYLLRVFGIMDIPIAFPIGLIIVGIGYLTPVRIPKPKLAGKIAILAVGFLEVVAMLIYIKDYLQ